MIDSHCADCMSCTWDGGEYYMVHHDLWSQYGVRTDLLCIGCLECRMGRTLVASDFTTAPINAPGCPWPRSERLQERLAA